MLPKSSLEKLYILEKNSVANIAKQLQCSQHKVNYWLGIHKIPKRSIAEAIYVHKNPEGHPFKKINIENKKDFFLFGLGLGLYWGEGTKANRDAVRLGNSDPTLVKAFIHFLSRLYGIKTEKLRFGLQIFTDIHPQKALKYWVKTLGVSPSQFYKPYVTVSVRKGTYGHRSLYGVVTVYVNNTRLQDILLKEIVKLQTLYYH